MVRVYFASAIENLSLEEVEAHYVQVAKLLESREFQMTNRNVQDYYLPQDCDSITRIREVIENDLHTLSQSDLLLVDYSIPNRNYVGCTCEIIYAYLWAKPIVVYVGQSSNGRSHWLRYHATYVCETVSQALDYMVKNYT